MIGHDRLEAGVVQHLLDGDAGMHRFQPHPLALLLEIEDAQRRDAEARPAAGQVQLVARIGAAFAEAEARAPVEPLGQRLLVVIVDVEIVAADVGAHAGGADAAGPAHLQMMEVAADADQVGVAVGVDLQAADEEDRLAPPLVEVRPDIVVVEIFGPARRAPVGDELERLEHLDVAQIGHGERHLHLQVRRVGEMRQQDAGAAHRQRCADRYRLVVLDLAGDERRHQLLVGVVLRGLRQRRSLLDFVERQDALEPDPGQIFGVASPAPSRTCAR